MYSYEAEIANKIIIMISKWKNPFGLQGFL